MVLRTKVSKQESGEKSFAVIKGGFDFFFFFNGGFLCREYVQVIQWTDRH